MVSDYLHPNDKVNPNRRIRLVQKTQIRAINTTSSFAARIITLMQGYPVLAFYMRRFIELSLPLILLLVPEFWKSAFESLRQSPYWRYAQILMVLWIVVVITYPLIAYLTGVNRTTAVLGAALIGALLFGGITLWLTTPNTPQALATETLSPPKQDKPKLPGTASPDPHRALDELRKQYPLQGKTGVRNIGSEDIKFKNVKAKNVDVGMENIESKHIEADGLSIANTPAQAQSNESDKLRAANEAAEHYRLTSQNLKRQEIANNYKQSVCDKIAAKFSAQTDQPELENELHRSVRSVSWDGRAPSPDAEIQFPRAGWAGLQVMVKFYSLENRFYYDSYVVIGRAADGTEVIGLLTLSPNRQWSVLSKGSSTDYDTVMSEAVQGQLDVLTEKITPDIKGLQ